MITTIEELCAELSKPNKNGTPSRITTIYVNSIGMPVTHKPKMCLCKELSGVARVEYDNRKIIISHELCDKLKEFKTYAKDGSQDDNFSNILLHDNVISIFKTVNRESKFKKI